MIRQEELLGQGGRVRGEPQWPLIVRWMSSFAVIRKEPNAEAQRAQRVTIFRLGKIVRTWGRSPAPLQNREARSAAGMNVSYTAKRRPRFTNRTWGTRHVSWYIGSALGRPARTRQSRLFSGDFMGWAKREPFEAQGERRPRTPKSLGQLWRRPIWARTVG